MLCTAGRFGMPAACALGIVRGKIIFNFGIAERLRTLRYPIFTGRGVTKNGSSSACFLRKRGAAGDCKRLDLRGGEGAYAVFLRKKSQKTFESPFYSILVVRYCVHRESPENKTDTQEGNTMKDFELRYVGSHVEVYTGSGVFLFSADTVREAMEELAR